MQDLHRAGTSKGTEGNIYRGNDQDGEKQSQVETAELILKVTVASTQEIATIHGPMPSGFLSFEDSLSTRILM